MGRRRRFTVESLAGRKAGDLALLPEGEVRHARVLRLEDGAEVEVFDEAGRTALGALVSAGRAVRLASAPGVVSEDKSARAPSLVLATAWPKGKRSAFLVEKCAELGAAAIQPVRWARSVVRRAEGAAGLERLRRVAAAAARQCGRRDAPDIAPEASLEQLLSSRPPGSPMVLLSPSAEVSLPAALSRIPAATGSVTLLIGPEGGLTAEELERCAAAGVARANLAEHVLRVETAAVAACAVYAAWAQGGARRPAG